MSATQLDTLLHCLRQIVNITHAITEEQKQQQQQQQQNDGETGHAHALKLLLLNSTTQDHNHDDHNHDDHDHGDHDHVHNESSEGLVLAKITAILVLFLASTLCGSIPFIIERFWQWKNNNKNNNNNNIKNNDDNDVATNNLISDPHATTIVKCLLYFGGGVLLCTTFIHLLPEVQESVEQLTDCGLMPKFAFPLAELLMCIGFFLMYLIEEIIHTYIHYAANKNNNNNNNSNSNKNNESDENMGVVAFERGHSIRRSCLLNGSKNKIKSKATTPPPLSEATTAAVLCTTIAIDKSKDDNNMNDEIKTISTHDLMTYDVEQAKYNEQQQQGQHQGHGHHHHHHNHHHSHYHGHSHHNVGVKKTNRDEFSASLRGLFIVLALSIHELFEGMAIGLEHSTASVWVMFGAVSAHKLVLAFCVGVELIVARTKLSLSILYIFTFAIVSPLGIGIGIAVSNADISGSNVVSVYLQGLACGTLLYVVFFEILSKNYAGLKALFALITGFCIMFGLTMLGEGGHEHSHGSCGSAATETTTTTATTTVINNMNTTMPLESLGLNEQLELLREASAQLLQLHTQTNAKK